MPAGGAYAIPAHARYLWTPVAGTKYYSLAGRPVLELEYGQTVPERARSG